MRKKKNLRAQQAKCEEKIRAQQGKWYPNRKAIRAQQVSAKKKRAQQAKSGNHKAGKEHSRVSGKKKNKGNVYPGVTEHPA